TREVSHSPCMRVQVDQFPREAGHDDRCATSGDGRQTHTETPENLEVSIKFAVVHRGEVMNGRQRAAILIGAALVVIAVICPPAKYADPRYPARQGWKLITSISSPYQIDTGLLAIEIGVIALVIGAVVMVLKERKATP